MGSRFAAPPYWRIVGSVFIGMLGFGAVIPVLPIHLKEQLFTSNWLTGLLIGIASAAALGGRLFAGRVADRKGRRNAFAIGLGFCGLAGIL
jgi:MFS family permease